MPNSSVAAITCLSPAALRWAMLAFLAGPAGMSLLGSTYPQGIGTLMVLTHRQGRAEWAVGASSPTVVGKRAKDWNGQISSMTGGTCMLHLSLV